jgi:hypothetical protein
MLYNFRTMYSDQDGARTNTRTHAHTRAHTYTHKHTHKHAHTHTNSHIHTQTHAQTQTHSHKHAHTQAPFILRTHFSIKSLIKSDWRQKQIRDFTIRRNSDIIQLPARRGIFLFSCHVMRHVRFWANCVIKRQTPVAPRVNPPLW